MSRAGDYRWPFPGDTVLARARKVALAYRARLAEKDPQGCHALDARMTEWGETWTTQRVETIKPDDWIPSRAAADLASVHPETPAAWRRAGLIEGRKVGYNRWEYRAGDILAQSARMKRRGSNAEPSPSPGRGARPQRAAKRVHH